MEPPSSLAYVQHHSEKPEQASSLETRRVPSRLGRQSWYRLVRKFTEDIAARQWRNKIAECGDEDPAKHTDLSATVSFEDVYGRGEWEEIRYVVEAKGASWAEHGGTWF